ATSSTSSSTSSPSRRRTPRPIPPPHRLSRSFSPTLRPSQVSSSSALGESDPLPSLQLLLRGGYIRSSSSGIFTLLPNARRIIDKITTIIDEELSHIGASRISMPSVLPSKLWKQTGRWHSMGSELYKLKDRKNSHFLLGPTHEEEVTSLIAAETDSQRQLPIRVYQVTTKFRDEPRPRMGLLRTKEFLMKDMYSFDASKQAADAAYDDVSAAYARIFDRIFATAEADTGAIGGNKSHEYHIEDPAGEDLLLSCSSCSYSANTEKAVSLPSNQHAPVDASDLRILLYGYRDVQIQAQVLYTLVLPASRTLNDTKLDKLLSKFQSEPIPSPPSSSSSSTKDSKDTTKSEKLQLQMLFDSASPSNSAVTGADWDWKDRPEGPLVRFERISVMADFECASLDPVESHQALLDALNTYSSLPQHASQEGEALQERMLLDLADLFPAQFSSSLHPPSQSQSPTTFVDLRTAVHGDTCPKCRRGKLEQSKAIEIGHTFYLGTRYSRALQAGFTPLPPASSTSGSLKGKEKQEHDHENEKKNDKEQEERLANGRIPFQMGCYGIGVSRILGALAQKAALDFNALAASTPPSTSTSTSTLTDIASTTASNKPKARSTGSSTTTTAGAGAGGVGAGGGLFWPDAVAPYTAVVVISDPKDPSKVQLAHRIYETMVREARRRDSTIRSICASLVSSSFSLGDHVSAFSESESNEPRKESKQQQQERKGGEGEREWYSDQEPSEIVLDDRTVAMGIKLSDADLVGYRYRFIVG
ncbi:class II aaRS and biotin synthetase, partial [Testicularia cyperi]